MKRGIEEAARYLHHLRTVGAGEAKRRLREQHETDRIREERMRGIAPYPEDRKKPGSGVCFDVVFQKNGAKEPEKENALQSLRQQTYPVFRIGAGADEPKEEDYLVFMEENGWLHPSVFHEAAKMIGETGAELLYADEQYFTDHPGDMNVSFHKPGYGPDTLSGCNLTEALLICSRRLLKECKAENYAEMTAEERWDASIRMAERAQRVERIPKALYYRRVKSNGEIPMPMIRRACDPINGEPLVSILIPNKDHQEDLTRCVESIRKKTTWPRWEIVIIENNSTEEATFRYYEELERDDRIRVIRWGGDFNYSAINNFGFRAAKGEQMLLLNNDTEILSPDWIQEMLRYAQRKDVGAVGAKLYYPDGTIQHGGIGIGIKIAAGHYFRGTDGAGDGYFRRLRYAQDVSAVTGACMMIPRHVYEEMKGLDEDYCVVFNDVDLCLRIGEAGYHIVWTPWAELTHYESKSRGSDEESKEKKRFFVRETNRFLRKWYRVLEEGDPYYNPNLTREKEDFSLR